MVLNELEPKGIYVHIKELPSYLKSTITLISSHDHRGDSRGDREAGGSGEFLIYAQKQPYRELLSETKRGRFIFSTLNVRFWPFSAGNCDKARWKIRFNRWSEQIRMAVMSNTNGWSGGVQFRPRL